MGLTYSEAQAAAKLRGLGIQVFSVMTNAGFEVTDEIRERYGEARIALEALAQTIDPPGNRIQEFSREILRAI